MPFLDEQGLERSLAGLWDKTKAYIDGRPSLVKTPVGTIVIWSGTTSDIPAGWQLCDGTNGTPDLRDKFVLGAGENHPVGESGGEEEVTLTVEQMPAHTHRVYLKSAMINNGTSRSGYGTAADHNNYGATEIIGGSQGHENMPPYYSLCYIMKVIADEDDGSTVIPITQEEYDALSKEERAGKIYLITDAGPNEGPTITLDEYDTDDGWHVRKWSDGYIEMICTVYKDVTANDLTKVGETPFYVASGLFIPINYPVALTTRYCELTESSPSDNGFLAGWIVSRGISGQNDLTRTREYSFFRQNSIRDDGPYTAGMDIFVAGRWK